MSSELHLCLRPSLIKMLIRLALCLILGYLLLQTLSSIFVIFIILLLIIFDFFLLRCRAIDEISYLDHEYWVIKSKLSMKKMRIIHGFIWGHLAILHFLDQDTGRKHFIYIAKDQLDGYKWKMLKKFIKLR